MRLIIMQRVSGERAVNTAAIHCPALLMEAAAAAAAPPNTVKQQSDNTGNC